jgi:hypothetical protein
MSDEKKRALITYRTKELAEDAKWSALRERTIDEAKDSADAMTQFYAQRTWPAMTGFIEVKSVTWPDED